MTAFSQEEWRKLRTLEHQAELRMLQREAQRVGARIELLREILREHYGVRV